jgi:hypothetical protein
VWCPGSTATQLPIRPAGAARPSSRIAAARARGVHELDLELRNPRQQPSSLNRGGGDGALERFGRARLQPAAFDLLVHVGGFDEPLQRDQASRVQQSDGGCGHQRVSTLAELVCERELTAREGVGGIVGQAPRLLAALWLRWRRWRRWFRWR